MDGKVIKRTQDTLGKIIKKPPLTDKLLGKPPFRFLHDIMTSVIKTTGLMKGLFTDSEMNSDNVKDKESKINFLQKAIDLTGMAVGRQLSVRPAKIVAGHEPEKTNEFLQALAEAINKKVDNDEMVSKVLGTGGKSSSSKRDASSDRRKKRDKEDKEEKGERSEKKHRSKDRDREDRKDREDKRDREKSRDRERSRDKDRDKERSKDREDKENEREDRKDRDERREEKEKERRRRREKEREAEKQQEEASGKQEAVMNGEAEPDKEAEAPHKIPRPSSAKGSRRRHKEDEEDERMRATSGKRTENKVNGTVTESDIPPQVAAARKTARPPSARPAAPRPKKNETAPEEPVVVSGSGNVPNLIVDKDQDSDDDDMFMAKEEEQPVAQEMPQMRQAPDQEEEGNHGGLVKKILETKKELEKGSQQPGAKKTEIERSSMVNDAERRKQREMVQKEIEKLRGSIQVLTRSANPLGQILDFVQEDLDSMQKELEMWKKENKENSQSLKREQSITENSVEPLKAQLTELDQAISDQVDLIAAVKNNILRNDDKIRKMLATVTKS